MSFEYQLTTWVRADFLIILLLESCQWHYLGLPAIQPSICSKKVTQQNIYTDGLICSNLFSSSRTSLQLWKSAQWSCLACKASVMSLQLWKSAQWSCLACKPSVLVQVLIVLGQIKCVSTHNEVKVLHGFQMNIFPNHIQVPFCSQEIQYLMVS